MTTEFKMPKLGESVTEGTIGRWLKQPGDALEQYEPMLEVTTDKVDTEVSSPIDGTLLEILVAEGETVTVGTVIARLGTNGTDGAASDTASATIPASPAATIPASVATTTDVAPSLGYVSPAVARLAAEHSLDLRQITGTGTAGRISKKDVERFLASGGSTPVSALSPTAAVVLTERAVPGVPDEPVPPTAQLQQAFESSSPDRTDAPRRTATPEANRSETAEPVPASLPPTDLLPLTPMRRAIAEHMVHSKRTAPHVTTVMEADLSRIVQHRNRSRATYERQGVKLTFTPYFVMAVVAALKAVPLVNGTFTDQGIRLNQHLNIGIATAIADGLIVPVLTDADERSLLGLARAVNDLADRARTRQLKPDETRGGTFTITNHGVSGSLFAMPIINQPQSAILGVGAIQKRVVVVSDNGQDAMAIRPMCYLSLTFDHRSIDGATADQFLATVKRTLETYDT